MLIGKRMHSRVSDELDDYIEHHDQTDDDAGMWDICSACEGCWRPGNPELHEAQCPVAEIRRLRARVAQLAAHDTRSDDKGESPAGGAGPVATAISPARGGHVCPTCGQPLAPTTSGKGR